MARRRAVTPQPSGAGPACGWVIPLGLGLALLAVFAVGKFTRHAVRTWDRYAVAFAEIDCTPPPGQDRLAFLAEVQYVAGMPDRLSVLDEDLASHVADAFARHPWVERVEKVIVLPTRQVQARLRFRIPALEVTLSDRARKMRPSRSDGQSSVAEEFTWVVDGYGFVLPRNRPGESLPLLIAEVGPAGGAGMLWGDEAVEAAARTAGYLRREANRLKLKRFETTREGLVLSTAAGTRVLWGHAPDSEPAGEASAAQKLERLLGYCSSHGALDQPAGRYEHDVRPADAASHVPCPGVIRLDPINPRP